MVPKNKDEKRAYDKIYYEANREIIRYKQKMYNEKNKEKILAYNKKRWPAYAERAAILHKEWYEANPGYAAKHSAEIRAKYPQKVKARSDVSNAIRDGRLLRQPCEICGNPKSQAHHDDYSKPLEIIWFCRKHHFEHHLNDWKKSITIEQQLM